MDTARARRPGRDVQRVNVDFPLDLLAAIDREADRIGVTRQAFIKMRLADSVAGAPAEAPPTVVNLMAALRDAMARATARAAKAPTRAKPRHETGRRKRA